MRDEIILVTGGAGFIGSAVIRHLIGESEAKVVNVDALTYAANLANLAGVENDPRYCFEHVNICSDAELERVFAVYHPTAVLHLAANHMSIVPLMIRSASYGRMCSERLRCCRPHTATGVS